MVGQGGAGAAAYCREIEAYLCRKNDGHLIRIVGPAFEMVSRWESQGVPLNVACAGIDRTFERYYKKGPRRRPVRIEFCEADVLDAFDGWRRAVGIGAARTAGDAPAADPDADPDTAKGGRRVSLAVHVERTIARLTAARAGAAAARDAAIETTVRALDAMAGAARTARGASRDLLIEQLAGLDRTLMAAIAVTLDDRARADLERAASAALAPFRDRMPPDAFHRASRAAFDRAVRDHFNLPAVTYDGG